MSDYFDRAMSRVDLGGFRPADTPLMRSLDDDKHPLSRSYRVGTEILEGTDAIALTTIDLAGEVRQRFLDTQEAQIRAKLIELGWTPPAEESSDG